MCQGKGNAFVSGGRFSRAKGAQCRLGRRSRSSEPETTSLRESSSSVGVYSKLAILRSTSSADETPSRLTCFSTPRSAWGGESDTW